MHRLFLAVALATAAALSGPTFAEGRLYRGPYLQQATTESVVVVWRTDGKSTPVLRYGDSPESLGHEVPVDAIITRVSVDVQAPDSVPRLYDETPEEAAKRNPNDEIPSTKADTYQFEAHVTGLQPDTKYYYAVQDGDRVLAGGDADHYFITHPPLDSVADMRIWVVGDSGTGDRNQAMVHEALRAYEDETDRPVDHYLHVGDMAYGDGADVEFQDHFFEPYQTTLRNTVCWPSMGNHEGSTSRGISGVGPYYDAYVVPIRAEAGGVASGMEAYYSFDIADVHFICLDSHDLDRSPDAAMAQWLRADLEQADAKWLIAFWHHPPYTKGSHDSDYETQLIEMRQNFMPILESAGVDLTLTGHSHIYERSMLMDGAYATPTVAEGVILDDGDGNPKGDGAYLKSEGLNPNEGAVNIVAGHGGTGNSRRGTMPVMREIILEHGSVILDIQGDTLIGTMLDKYGKTRDLFSIVKRGQVTPERVDNPWQPVHDLSLLTRLSFNFSDDAVGTVPEHWQVASGDKTAVAVMAPEDGKRKFLRVAADDQPSIGLFDAFEIKEFEYESYIRLPNAEDTAGLIFGYVDDANYWRIMFDAVGGAIRASRIADGKETVLAEQPAEIEVGKWMKVETATRGARFGIEFQDTLRFDFELGAELPEAQLGFLVPEQKTADFLLFQIER